MHFFVSVDVSAFHFRFLYHLAQQNTTKSATASSWADVFCLFCPGVCSQQQEQSHKTQGYAQDNPSASYSTWLPLLLFQVTLTFLIIISQLLNHYFIVIYYFELYFIILIIFNLFSNIIFNRIRIRIFFLQTDEGIARSVYRRSA